MSDTVAEAHPSRRVRHETRRRLLTVAAVEVISPRMRRLHLEGDMGSFASLAADDHIKLFFPMADGVAMRDFTPRRFDVAAGTLAIDFALHEAGPATAFAAAAKPGDTLEIGGPRGSMVIADDFDWYWLIGDETALPAIGRFAEEMAVGKPLLTVVAIEDANERQAFVTGADWRALWAERRADGLGDAAALIALLDAEPLPAGDGFVFVAAESSVARAVRSRLLERGHPKGFMKAAGYWKRGETELHEHFIE